MRSDFLTRRRSTSSRLLWFVLCTAFVITGPVGAAAQAWHLLLPPRDGTGWTNLGAPLGRWVNIGAFATMAECKTDQDRRARELRGAVKQLVSADPTRGAMLVADNPDPVWKNEYYRLWGDIGRLRVGRCVSTSDPRLSRKPAR